VSAADDLLNLIRTRRSVRRFRDEPVSRDILERLIEAASWAPSAGNAQDWRFTVVTSPSRLREMNDAARRAWEKIIAAHEGSGLVEDVGRYAARFSDFAAAPALIVVSARATGPLHRRLLGDAAAAGAGSAASAAMAAQTLLLAAHALGLGACPMTGPLAARDELARLIGLERKQDIVCVVALGYPAEAPATPRRKPVGEIARFVE